MFKTIGLMMIFLSSLLVGASAVLKLRERVNMLCAVKMLVCRLDRKLTLFMPEFSRLFDDENEYPISQLTDTIREEMAKGASARESVGKAFSSECVTRLLKAEERGFLTETFAAIGESDIDSAKKLLSDMETTLDVYISQARESEKKDSKVALALPVYIGAAAVIILM